MHWNEIQIGIHPGTILQEALRKVIYNMCSKITLIKLLPHLPTNDWTPLQWRHNGRDGVSYHQPNDCLLKRLFRVRWKKASKLHVTGLCGGNSPVTGEFPAHRASNAENASI